jgi:hypothetical protein
MPKSRIGGEVTEVVLTKKQASDVVSVSIGRGLGVSCLTCWLGIGVLHQTRGRSGVRCVTSASDEWFVRALQCLDLVGR